MDRCLNFATLAFAFFSSCAAGRIASEEEKSRAWAITPGVTFDLFPHLPVADSLYKDALLTLSKYKPESGDVWIASYPKSGTNWLKQIVHMINLNGDEDAIKKYEQSGEDLSFTIPMPEVMGTNFDEMKRPRSFFTHLTPDLKPKGGKVIYTIRKPEDIAQSYYNYMTQIDFGFGYGFVNQTVEDAAYGLMDGVICYGNWQDHVKAWINEPHVLLVKFEDLKRDLSGAVARIAKFMRGTGANALTEAQLKVVTEKSTFEYMKKREAQIQGKEWIESLPQADNHEAPKATDMYTLVESGKTNTAVYEPATQKAWERWYEEKVAPALGITSYNELKLRDVIHDEL